jgi:[citrate (pro-3S)-lyase] ligase
MSYEVFYEDFGYPFKGSKLQKLKEFLSKENLEYDQGIEYTVILRDTKGNIAATGSLEGNVLKCIAVFDLFQGDGLAAKIVTALTSQAINSGHSHLFIFTKVENISIFNDLGFYLIASTKDVALMENRKNGISEFVNSLKSSVYDNIDDNVGAIVLNCNPFTNGHLYLIESAARECSLLHLFVVSEDKSVFPAKVRYGLVKSGIKHLNNVVVHPTSDYLISSATFPTYFIKDKYKAGNVNCILDLTIFSDYFAKILNIKKRFVGTEPFDIVTASYNEQMRRFLGRQGIEVIEIPRFESNNSPISASRVRKLMTEGEYKQINNLVPPVTYEYLISEEGKKIAEKLRSQNV